jgi:hypothetical protein
MKIQHFFDSASSTLTYVIWDEDSREGVVVDPVMDLDLRSGQTS